MRVLEGKSVFSGIAIGKISILQKADTSVKRTKVEDPEAEIARVQEAKDKAVAQLQTGSACKIGSSHGKTAAVIIVTVKTCGGRTAA